jgi:hypothetical protein
MDEKAVVKAIAEGTAKGAADSLLKPFHELTGRLCVELGEAAGNIGQYIRLATGIKIMKRAERMLRAAGIEPRSVPRKLFLPMLESASLEDDESLQSRWAALLANAADSGRDSEVPPSFASILSQLTIREVKLLDSLHKKVFRAMREHFPDYPLNGNWAYLVDLGKWPAILKIYAQLGLTRNKASVLLNYVQNKKQMSESVSTDYCAFRVTLENLFGLQLLIEMPDPGIDNRPFHITLTATGFEFIRACSEPGRPVV